MDDVSAGIYHQGITRRMMMMMMPFAPVVNDGTERGAIGHTSLIAARIIRIVVARFWIRPAYMAGKKVKKVTRQVEDFAVLLLLLPMRTRSLRRVGSFLLLLLVIINGETA
jgi:hypothetical protein